MPNRGNHDHPQTWKDKKKKRVYRILKKKRRNCRSYKKQKVLEAQKHMAGRATSKSRQEGMSPRSLLQDLCVIKCCALHSSVN
jgi:hypothetical protein